MPNRAVVLAVAPALSLGGAAAAPLDAQTTLGFERTEVVVTTGYARLWMRVDGPGGRTLSTESMSTRRPRGTTLWTRYEIELPVDSSAAHNNRRVYSIPRPAPGSLESILHHAPWRYTFVDLSRAERQPGTEWMFRPITAREWGLRPQTLVARDEYDAILFVDRTWPPGYVH